MRVKTPFLYFLLERTSAGSRAAGVYMYLMYVYMNLNQNCSHKCMHVFTFVVEILPVAERIFLTS